jgi:RsiW-degrading membrane proteinase PrsW (M82 family)
VIGDNFMHRNQNKKALTLPTKFLIIGLLLVATATFAFWFGLSHPTATSPLSPVVMRALVFGAFFGGIALAFIAVVWKVARLIKK